MSHKTKHSETINHSEHIAPEITGDNIAAKKVANYVWNSGTSEWERMTPAAGGGGGTQYQEDAAAGAGSTGNLLLGIRDDGGGTRVSADGDFTALSIDSSGRLRTVVSGAGSGGTSSTDDVAFTVGSDAGTGAMAIYQSVEDSVDDGDIGVLAMTANRHLKVELQNTVDLGATDNAVLDSIDTAVNGTLTVDGSGVTQPVSASSLPLPTGAATAANQSTLIGHVDGVETLLSAIDAGKLEEATFTGRVGEVSATPTANTVLGRLKDIDDALAGTLTVDGSGATQPISASSLPLPAGAATAANQASVLTLLGTIDADTSLLAGAVSGTELQVDIVSSAAIPITDNGSTITVDDGGTSLTVDGTVTANLSATDNAVLDTIAANTGRGSSSSLANVSGSATSVQILAANASRLEAIITNDSTADLYLKLGTTASTTSYTVKLGQDESYITDKYTGRIDGIWASATGAARVTEIS